MNFFYQKFPVRHFWLRATSKHSDAALGLVSNVKLHSLLTFPRAATAPDAKFGRTAAQQMGKDGRGFCRTFQVKGHHHCSIFQSIDNLTFVFPIILQGDFGDDQRGVHGGGGLQVDAAVETAIAPFVVIHGDKDVHLHRSKIAVTVTMK